MQPGAFRGKDMRACDTQMNARTFFFWASRLSLRKAGLSISAYLSHLPRHKAVNIMSVAVGGGRVDAPRRQQTGSTTVMKPQGVRCAQAFWFRR